MSEKGMGRKTHWESVYDSKSEDQVSWFQREPEPSLRMLRDAGLGPGARILDVGGGASRLVDRLLEAGHTGVGVMDVAESGLRQCMDRLGRKYAIVPSFVIQAIGMGLVPITGSFAGLLLAASLIGFGNGFSSGSMMTLGADLSPPDARGEFLGVWRLIGDAGHSGGPLVVGAVADAVALPAAALMMACAGLVAGTIFGLLVPETLDRRRPAARLSTSSD